MKKVCIRFFDKQEKPWIFFKIFQKKNKNFKAIRTVLDYSKPEISSSANHGGRHFFNTWPSNYFSAATALHMHYFLWVIKAPVLNLDNKEE